MTRADPTALKPHGSHPALAATPPGTWNPSAVGRVRGYAKTQAAYNRQVAQLRANREAARAAGTMNRRGVPNGYAGRRDEAEATRQQAADAGWVAVQAWQRNAQTPGEQLSEERIEAIRSGQDHAWTDAEYFAVAAAYMISIVVDPSQPTRARLQAARAILPFLRAAPSGKSRENAQSGMAWLIGLAGAGAGVA